MKKATVTRKRRTPADEMRAEYDFSRGVRGKHHVATKGGYTVTVHMGKGRKVVKHITPIKAMVVLDADVQAYFPDSRAVNRALRSLLQIIPSSKRAITNRGRTASGRGR
jgi:hypothetical protein